MNIQDALQSYYDVCNLYFDRGMSAIAHTYYKAHHNLTKAIKSANKNKDFKQLLISELTELDSSYLLLSRSYCSLTAKLCYHNSVLVVGGYNIADYFEESDLEYILVAVCLKALEDNFNLNDYYLYEIPYWENGVCCLDFYSFDNKNILGLGFKVELSKGLIATPYSTVVDKDIGLTGKYVSTCQEALFNPHEVGLA